MAQCSSHAHEHNLRLVFSRVLYTYTADQIESKASL